MYWIAPLAGGYLSAVWLLLSIRRDRNALQTVFYRGNAVKFRGSDEQALREVLIDREYAFLVDYLTALNNPKVIDVGAHIGTFAIWVFGVKPVAKVLSVEADPQTYQVLTSNAETYRKGQSDWRILHAAAVGQDGGVFRLSNAGPSMSHRIDPKGTIEVPGVRLATLLDDIVPDGSRVDLLKVDVEGSEEAFLCEAADALNVIDCLVIELHPTFCDTGRVQSMLEKYYDDIRVVGGRKSSKPLLYCRRSQSMPRV